MGTFRDDEIVNMISSKYQVTPRLALQVFLHVKDQVNSSRSLKCQECGAEDVGDYNGEVLCHDCAARLGEG